MSCLIYHRWSPWCLVRAWDFTIEEYRACCDCGKMQRGDSWRCADREAIIKLHAETIPVPAKVEHPWGKEGVELFAGARQ